MIRSTPFDPILFQRPEAFLRNPTFVLFASDVAMFAVSTALLWAGAISREAAAVVSFVCLYSLYTVSHEAAHGNAHTNRYVNGWMGRIAAALEGLTFPLFRTIHLQHHAFTNDPARDPDYVIGKRPPWLLPLWTLVRLTHDNQFLLSRKLWADRKLQLWEHLATVAVQLAVVGASIAAGRFELVLWGWL